MGYVGIEMSKLDEMDIALLEEIASRVSGCMSFHKGCKDCPLRLYCDEDSTVSETQRYAKEILDRHLIENVLLEDTK